MTTPTLTCSVRTEPGATDQPMRITGTQNTRSDEQLSEFENYLEHRKRIEEVKAALNRCRALAQRIQYDLRNKKPEHFADVWALADFQVALEHAASMLCDLESGGGAETRSLRSSV